MTNWLKYVGIAGALLLAATFILGGSTLAFAASAWQGGAPFAGRGGFDGPGDFMGNADFDGKRGGPGQRGGAGGEVTAIDGNTLTVTNPNGDTLTVTTTDTTRVMLAESQSEGTLADVTVGANIGVRGRPNSDGVVEAVAIVVLPAGDTAGGRVTAVDGQSISVEDPRSGDAATIVTNDETTFRLGRDGEGSLADVTVGGFAMGYGDLQDDGSLAARLVMVGGPDKRGGPDGPGGRDGHRGPRGAAAVGEVTAIDGSTLTVDPFWGESDLTVQTDEATTYRTRTGEELAFEDISVGSWVMAKGQPVDGAENTILAEVIGIKK